jgi:hypothetical protein
MISPFAKANAGIKDWPAIHPKIFFAAKCFNTAITGIKWRFYKLRLILAQPGAP